MSISTEYQPKIIHISDVVGGFVVVLIKPPYRDFPNIVAFKYDEYSKKWIRPFETFCIGIQDKKSEILDLHTKGFAIDFNIGSDTVLIFNDKVKRIISAMSNKSHGIVIPYQNFYHSHFSQTMPEVYTIDKTEYKNIAIKLGYTQYEKYPSNQCIMFDTPQIKTLTLEKKADAFHLTCTTDNGQNWMITFTGLTDDGQYFKSKTISVTNE